MSSLTINKSSISDLLEILKRVSGNVQKENTFFKIDNGRVFIRSLDGSMSFMYKLKEDLRISANLDLFDFIKFLEMSIIYDDIELKDEGNVVIIKTEKNKIKLSKKQDFEFSDIEELLNKKEYLGRIKLEDIESILDVCKNFNYGKSKDRSLSDRIRLENSDCVATDGSFLLRSSITFEQSINFNVSEIPKILKVLQYANNDIMVYKVENWNVFESDNISYLFPQIEDSFPNYKSVYPDLGKYNNITIDKSTFKNIIKEIDNMLWVRLKTEGNDLVIYYVEDNRIEIENKLEIKEKNGVDINLKMNPRKLYSILDFIKCYEIGIWYNSEKPVESPVYIKDGSGDRSDRDSLIMCLAM